MPTPTAPPWDHLYNDIKITMPAVTDAVMKQVLFQVTKDFCDKTNIWTEDVPIPVQPNVTTYNFTVADSGAPNRLMLVYDPNVMDPDKKWVQTAVMMQKPGTITISFSPSAATTWNAVIAKTPLTSSSDGFPDLGAGIWLVDKYRDCLTFGVMARLMGLPAKPFSNPGLAKTYYQFYVAERSKARGDAIKANTFGGQRWMYPQSWASPHRGGWA